MKNYIKKTASILLLVCLILTMIPVVANAASGMCGDNVSWTLSGYSLTIEGSGKMVDYTEDSLAPWYWSRDSIRKITVKNGVTSIGDLAFYGCNETVSASVASTVESVGLFSFGKCSKLVSISGMTGLRVIGESAFEECESLVAFNFPTSLTTVSTRAFYRCYSLVTVTIPSSVTQMGASVFAYCESLYSATVNAAISALPVWTFYGCSSITKVILASSMTAVGEYSFNNCDNLFAICYKGSYEDGTKLLEDAKNADADFPDESFIFSNDYPSTPPSVSTTETDTSVSTSVTTVVESDNAVISKTETTVVSTDTSGSGTPSPSTTPPSTSIDGIVKNEQGWQEVIDVIKTTEEKREENDTSPINVDVKLSDTSVISGDVLKQLSETNSVVQVTTDDGAIVGFKTEDLDNASFSTDYDISYDIVKSAGLTEEQKKTVGDVGAFELTFKDDIDFNFMTKIYLGSELANQTATLYQHNPDSGLERLQSVIVDANGYAQFLLASVAATTEYFVAMNVAGEQGNAVIPDSLKSEYGNPENYAAVEYVQTGVRKMFGLTIKQFSLAAAAIVIVFVILVGAVMFIINKQKQKNANIYGGKKK